MNTRLLFPSEIDARVGMCKENGCTLLLYKDARVDMLILDETFGAKNWQRTHEVINGNLFCNIDVWDDDKKIWVRKQDVGVESMAEKEKGQASDSFKRTAVNWGIGRELYTAPFIWVQLKANEVYKSGNSFKTNVKFKVVEIGYNNREISKLAIADTSGAIRYSFGTSKKQVESKTESEMAREYLMANSAALEYYLKKYSVGSLDDITNIQLFRIYEELKKNNKL